MPLRKTLPAEYYILDFGGRRFTHYPTNDILVRTANLIEPSGHPRWKEIFQSYRSRHVAAHVVFNSDYHILDDILFWPITGGSYQIGDQICCQIPGRNKWDKPRAIIDRFSLGTNLKLSAGEIDYDFMLDDGALMIWRPAEDMWVTTNTYDQRNRRASPVLDFNYNIVSKGT